jgi:hypothetical protein
VGSRPAIGSKELLTKDKARRILINTLTPP